MNVFPNTSNHAPEVRVVSGRTFDGVPFPVALEVNREIDHGATARIYKGEMLAGERLVVAVKVFGQMLGPVEQELLVRELRAARKVSLRHPLILAFLGTADTGQQTSIVSLYMRNGNLIEYLKSHPGCDKKALVAEGVNYLHTVEGLVHGDLKCANVLISDYGEALLADFGLSTFVEKSQSAMATMTGIRQLHTARFAAPELLFGTAPQSKTRESDVYAFGMLVLEAVTEQPPWWGVVATELAVMIQVSEGRHPPQPTLSSGFVAISHHWWDVCKSCWSREPGHRPRMPSILDALQPASLDPCRPLEGHNDTVMSVAYVPGGHRIVSRSYDETIRVWDSVTGHTVIGPIHSDRCSVACLAVSPKGHRICSSGWYFTIRRWDADSGASIGKPMAGHDQWVNGVAYSPDGRRIVSCSRDLTVRVWDASTGEALGDPLRGHSEWINSVAFSTDGACIASGSLDGTICLWGSTTGLRLGTLQQASAANSVCFSPNRVHLVAGGLDGVIRIWNISTRQLARDIPAHSLAVNSVSVSPSGMYIASASDDRSIRIWDAGTGAAVGAPLTGHTGSVRSVAFSPDGRSLVSGSNDSTVRIWDLFE